MDGKIESTQAQFLLDAFNLIVSSGLHPETPIKEWVPTLLFLHEKKWLWGAYEDGRLACVGAAYKMRDFDGKYPERFPEDEDPEGDQMYVSFLVSRAKDRLLPRRMLTRFLDKNPTVREVILFDTIKKNGKEINRLRRFRYNKKESENGKGKTEVTG